MAEVVVGVHVVGMLHGGVQQNLLWRQRRFSVAAQRPRSQTLVQADAVVCRHCAGIEPCLVHKLEQKLVRRCQIGERRRDAVFELFQRQSRSGTVSFPCHCSLHPATTRGKTAKEARHGAPLSIREFHTGLNHYRIEIFTVRATDAIFATKLLIPTVRVVSHVAAVKEAIPFETGFAEEFDSAMYNFAGFARCADERLRPVIAQQKKNCLACVPGQSGIVSCRAIVGECESSALAVRLRATRAETLR